MQKRIRKQSDLSFIFVLSPRRSDISNWWYLITALHDTEFITIIVNPSVLRPVKQHGKEPAHNRILWVCFLSTCVNRIKYYPQWNVAIFWKKKLENKPFSAVEKLSLEAKSSLIFLVLVILCSVVSQLSLSFVRIQNMLDCCFPQFVYHFETACLIDL